MHGCEDEMWEWMKCDQCFPSQPFVMLTVHQFVGHGMEFLTCGGCEDEYNKYRIAKEVSEISQVYLRAEWKELTAIINWVSSSLVEEVIPMQLSMYRP